jgi:hydrogenase maturation protease
MTWLDRPSELLVLGLGNVLCGDDGVGPAAINLLARRYDSPEGVMLIDGGTLGLALLPYIEDAQRVLLIDAVRTDQPPGSFVRLHGEEVAPAVAARLSVHQVGVAELLEAARWRGTYPPQLTLLGLVPATLELGLKRTAAVETQLPELVERIVEEAARLGYRFREKNHETAGARGAGRDMACVFGL